MPRVCLTLQVRRDGPAEYRERHAAVWPEMLRALEDAGRHDHQLFLRDDGLLVGTLLTGDLAGARAAMEKTSINLPWQADTARSFDLPDRRPDRGMRLVDLVFDLDAQPAAAGETTPSIGETP